MSLGSIEELSDVFFEGNAFYCARGMYGYDEDSSAEQVMT